MAAGRPAKFQSVEELQEKIDLYFVECKANKDHPCITGLALALETTRETLLDYEKNNPNLKAFSDTIKRAKLRCQNYAEQKLFDGNCTGVIFNLKNNYGWRDEKSHNINAEVNATVHDAKLRKLEEEAEKELEEELEKEFEEFQDYGPNSIK